MQASGYEPKFDFVADLERGAVGEGNVNALIEAIRGNKFEVKTDYRAKETGNFYIETYQYNAFRRWPSGVNATESDYWAFDGGFGRGLIWIKIDALKELVQEYSYRESRQGVYSDVTNASEGVLVPVEKLLEKIGLWGPGWQLFK